jgi:hypothetical protein
VSLTLDGDKPSRFAADLKPENSKTSKKIEISSSENFSLFCMEISLFEILWLVASNGLFYAAHNGSRLGFVHLFEQYSVELQFQPISHLTISKTGNRYEHAITPAYS